MTTARGRRDCEELEGPEAAPDGRHEVLTVAQAARFLDVGRTRLYDAIARGEVPHRRIGRSIRLSRALVAWLNAPGSERR